MSGPAQLIFLLLLGGGANVYAWRSGFYTLPEEKMKAGSFRDVCLVFLIYLIMALVIVPGLFLFFLGEGLVYPVVQGTASAASIIACFFILFCGTLYWRRNIIGELHDGVLKMAVGASVWFLAYPLVALWGSFVAALLHVFFEYEPIDQTAVQVVKGLSGYPVILTAMLFCIAVLVPAIEELLFRGYLQSWLRGRYGRAKAIIITSLIFASFHFSMAQGLSNIEVISSLFLFSCFLGFLYEKERSLLAPIALHGAFNAVSLSLIYYQM